MKIRSSSQFMSKLITYQGLLVFIPYVIIKTLTNPNNPIILENSIWIFLSLIILFSINIIFDFNGMKTKFLDIHCRLISTISGVIGIFFTIYSNPEGEKGRSLSTLSVFSVISLWYMLK